MLTGEAAVVHSTDIAKTARIVSVDAQRGFVMFMMIFVNDLAGAGRILPDWMVHFSDRHHGGSGMTFVDLVFPAFLFIMGMSIPLSLGGRKAKGENLWKIVGHVGVRTVSLLLIGILMVHGTPDAAAMGWSGDWWCVLMYLSAIAAFSVVEPRLSLPKSKVWTIFCSCLRLAGLAALVWLAFAFRGANGQRIVALAPLSLDTQWYGILGLIGWAYLVGCAVFLSFGNNRTAILACMVLLMCLFPADRAGLFEGFWLDRIVGIGSTLGSQGAIAAGGLLLGSMLTAHEVTSFKARTRFTFWFVAGCAAAALLLSRTYGISKNQATPSWCLWACAITAALWYGFFLIADVRPVYRLSRPLALAGQNVLLAYLISEMLPGLLHAIGLSASYDQLAANLPSALIRAVCCGLVILALSTSLNAVGLRLRL